VGDGWPRFTLRYPFPLTSFWEAVDEIEQVLLWRMEADGLPDEDEFLDALDLLRSMADLLETDPRTLFDHIGGAWRPVPATHLTGVQETPYRWYGAGVPLQVLLGFGGEYATVAAPKEIPLGLRGPDRLEQGTTVEVELHRPETLRELRSAVRTVTDEVTQDWSLCLGCHQLRSLQSYPGYTMPVCLDCASTYHG